MVATNALGNVNAVRGGNRSSSPRANMNSINPRPSGGGLNPPSAVCKAGTTLGPFEVFKADWKSLALRCRLCKVTVDSQEWCEVLTSRTNWLSDNRLGILQEVHQEVHRCSGPSVFVRVKDKSGGYSDVGHTADTLMDALRGLHRIVRSYTRTRNSYSDPVNDVCDFERPGRVSEAAKDARFTWHKTFSNVDRPSNGHFALFGLKDASGRRIITAIGKHDTNRIYGLPYYTDGLGNTHSL